MTKKKSFISLVLAFCLIIPAMFLLSACGGNNTQKLKSDDGIVVEGGNFEDGVVLETSEIDSESSDYKTTISLIASEDYDADKPVYIFEISVKKDNVKVQPKGKVKVSVPIDTNLTGYDVLHIKDDGKIERLSVTYKNGIATFETDSFSKFVFVKKATPAPTPDDGGDDTGDDTTTKYTIRPYVDTIIPDSSDGGAVRDKDGEYITYDTLKLAENSECVLKSHCYPDYYFLGWYEATEDKEATEDNFLSNESTYTFTVTKNIDILALYAYKTHAVRFTLVANNYGFSYRNGEPTVTLVSSSADGEKPNHKKVEVRYLKGDGSEDGYGNYYSEHGFQKNVDMEIVDSNNTIVEELDYSQVGQYTITYYHKRNHNIKASLYVNVVESAHTLNVSTSNKNLQFRYNVSGTQTSLQEVLPTGRLVTLTAETKDNYAFTGWYDENNNFVSKAIVYCFEMPDKDVTLYGTYTSSSKYLQFYGPNYNQGELLDEYGNEYIGSSKIYYKGDINVNLTVREKSAYEFLGWYDVTDDKTEFLTKDKTLNLELDDESTNMSVSSSFREKLKYIEFDSDTLADECVSNGKIGFAIGDAEIDYKNFTINAKGAAGSYGTLSSSNYTIDDSTLDFTTAGTYTITYTYNHDATIKTQIQIVVIDPENANFTFEHGYSYLDHEFDGKATFISLKDVEVDCIALYGFKDSSKIWKKLSYKWIDKTTNKEVDEKYTKGVDITINGTVVKDFGPENYKRNIGNEFGGPIKAGSYRFELMYDGKTVVSQDSTISTQTYKKITSADELKSNEGSTWVNFELYYYTIIAKADNGKYYVMQMPSIGSGTEAEAREISVDNSGNAAVGDGNDFAFAYVRYIAGYDDSLEFMTGYYGSYVSRTSGSTVDGTWLGSPYIYRTGYTNITDGEISREYGNKENYGLSITFAGNGAVTIHSNSGSDNGRLRLVKNSDGTYVFTSTPADDDSRESFDVFIYGTIIDTSVEESNK